MPSTELARPLRTLIVVAAIAVILPITVAAVVTPSLAVSPSSGPAGTKIQVTGTGFAARAKGQLLFDGSATSMPTFKVSAKGTFTVAVTVPGSIAAGTYVIGAKMLSGSESGQTVATASFSIPVPATPSATPTATPSPTPTPTAAPTATPTPVDTPTPTPSDTPSPTPSPTPTPVVTLPAFPGAIGYGAFTPGGRGGDVYVVTTLADSGPGSLRAALEAAGPRTVVFGVSGTITLASTVKVRSPYLTIAGQTAPGDGIVVRGDTVRILTHDVIIRHLRFRTGDATTTGPADADGLTVHAESGPISGIILDHVDMVWGPDIGGLAVLGPVTNLTVQSSILGEGLYLSRHPEGTVANGGHAYAMNVTPLVLNGGWASRLTFYRNLFTDADKRMPAIRSAECVDLVDNVIYDWGRQAVVGNPRSLNVVGNWFRWGPMSVTKGLFKSATVNADPNVYADAVYLDRNVADGFSPSGATGTVYSTSVRCGRLSVPSAGDPGLLNSVLDEVGATLPVRDEVDRRIVDEVSTQGGTYFNGVDYPPPNPYWPELAAGTPAIDVDADGMPDAWELTAFGDTSRDGRADNDGDGYTDLEEYLNATAP